MALADQIPTQSGWPAKSTGAEVLAACELAGRVAIVTGGYSGIGLETVRALAAGGIFTPLQRHLSIEEQVRLGWVNEDGSPSALAKAGFKTTEQGCSTTLWAASSPLLEGRAGVYCEDCDIAAPTDPASPMARFRGVNAHACDDEAAERLWAMSEAMLRVA